MESMSAGDLEAIYQTLTKTADPAALLEKRGLADA
jgi:hypothetical protein